MQKLDMVCLIDDDKMFTYLLSKQMNKIDFADEIMVYHEGMEALNYLRDHAQVPEKLPSVILLDINMPVMDGWRFLNEFTRLGINKRIITYIVSSSIDCADHIKAANFKAVSNFLIKPVTKDNLKQIQNEAVAYKTGKPK